MTANCEQLQEVNGADVALAAPRSIRAIIADLSKPLAARHLKTKPATKQGGQLTYIEWHTAVRYLDHFAPGWSYSVKSVVLVGNLVTVIAAISIPCAEGMITREATGCEEIDAKGYGDAVSNAEAMALKRAAAPIRVGIASPAKSVSAVSGARWNQSSRAIPTPWIQAAGIWLVSF